MCKYCNYIYIVVYSYAGREREGSHVTLVPITLLLNPPPTPPPHTHPSHSLSLTLTILSLSLSLRGKTSFDQSGVGAELPAEVKKEDDEFDLYRKRMMLAYRFRPNPLVRLVVYYIHACDPWIKRIRLTS